MGTFWESESEVGERKEKKKGQEKPSVDAETAKQALKAIIMFAKLAMAKNDFHDGLQLWTGSFPAQSFAEPSGGLPFFIILVMVFAFGLMIGAILAWSAIYPYFSRVTLSACVKINIVPRPTFLLHESCPASTSTTLLRALLRALGMPRALLRAGRAADASLRALGVLWALLQALTLRLMALPLVIQRPPAGPSSISMPAAAQCGNLKSRARRSATNDLPLLFSPTGQRSHCVASCTGPGLRNARVASQCSRCEHCGPVQSRR